MAQTRGVVEERRRIVDVADRGAAGAQRSRDQGVANGGAERVRLRVQGGALVARKMEICIDWEVWGNLRWSDTSITVRKAIAFDIKFPVFIVATS